MKSVPIFGDLPHTTNEFAVALEEALNQHMEWRGDRNVCIASGLSRLLRSPTIAMLRFDEEPAPQVSSRSLSSGSPASPFTRLFGQPSTSSPRVTRHCLFRGKYLIVGADAMESH